MSWFIGYTGKDNPELNKYISSLDPGKKKEFKSDNLYLIYNGEERNIEFNFKNKSSGWIVGGIPLSAEGEEFKFVRKNNWQEIFSKEDFKLQKNINGHFAGIKWDSKTVTFFNDSLGLRDIYFLKISSNYFFSTRPDWILNFKKENKIDLDGLSTNWLLPHQISWGSILKDVIMLNPGGVIKISSGVMDKINSPWMPHFNQNIKASEFIDTLNSFIKLLDSESEKINLGFSGGIDSRVLLQTLFNNKINTFGTHTFGSSATADGRIAERIISDNNLEHIFFSVSLSNFDQLIKYLYGAVSRLGLSASIYETLNYPFYELLGNQNYTIIDGAYGEIFRRAYLNRFLIMGKKALLDKDAAAIFGLLKRVKANIFNCELHKLLEENAVDQIVKILEVLPGPDSIGIENWLDTFFIKTKVANISGPSQSLLDNISKSLMPFIQPSILDKGFSMDFSNKKNGKLFFQLIKEGKKLNRYPLVKDQIIYPFSSNLLFTRMYQKLKRKAGLVYKDNVQNELILKLRDFILDRINSLDVKNCDMYDYKKVSNLAFDFYNGNNSLVNDLTWWTTFDIWRESFNIK